MSLSKRPALLSFAVAALLAVAGAEAKGHDVCPTPKGDSIQQIYVFDGAPDTKAYLAPDGPESNTYTVKPIYDKGGFVTVRCEYQRGPAVDIVLKSANRCVFRKAGLPYGKIRCW